MAMNMRLQRMGAKKQPRYRIVVMEQSDGASAGYIEKIGNYFPEASDEKDEVEINEDKAIEWLGNGAQPSETVKDLLSDEGILEKLHEEGSAA
ncbi:MAG: 30S ribosomal protein S16 [bacterium]